MIRYIEYVQKQDDGNAILGINIAEVATLHSPCPTLGTIASAREWNLDYTERALHRFESTTDLLRSRSVHKV